jgi:predicted glycosyltransferase
VLRDFPNASALPHRGLTAVSTATVHGSSPRVALYSHDTVGLGHVRRNQLIARALAAPPLNASVLLITGVREGGGFAVPDGIDSLILPAYRKGLDGSYSARSLDMTADQLTRLRADLIDTALARFEPDLLIADNVPRGARDELMPALLRLKAGGRTRCVLGLRDILDDPATIRREWAARDNFTTLRTLYDAVWVYGDPAVYDTASEYDFPAALRAMTAQVGYLDPCHAASSPWQSQGPSVSGRPLILCSAGGGEDGFRLARRFCAVRFPNGVDGVVVTGPLMAPDQREALLDVAGRRGDLQVIEATYDPLPLIRRADRVIAMAGYNTVNEILALGKRALLVPRIAPRMEQLLRARRMAELGLATMMADDDATPERLAAWIASRSPVVPARGLIDFNGLDAVVRRAAAMLRATSEAPSDVTAYRAEVRSTARA